MCWRRGHGNLPRASPWHQHQPACPHSARKPWRRHLLHSLAPKLRAAHAGTGTGCRVSRNMESHSQAKGSSYDVIFRDFFSAILNLRTHDDLTFTHPEATDTLVILEKMLSPPCSGLSVKL